MSAKFKVLGVNDDKDFCECCGRAGLKRVVWIENNETGEIRHFGTTCAESPAKSFGMNQEIKKEIKNWETTMRAIWFYASKIHKAKGGKYISNGIPLEKGGGLIPADKDLFAACLKEAREKVLGKKE